MHLVPTQSEVIELLRRTGALRDGHFECPNGLHADQYLEPALAMRHYSQARTLSVGLSRPLRANSELRAMIPELSIVAATPGGLPVAYGLCEALRARQVYWAEKEDLHQPMHFRQFLEPAAGEKVLLVDDILRAGKLLRECQVLLESRGAQVVGLAVLIHQPTPHTHDFTPLPLFYLARLEARYYADARSCELCKGDVPLYRVGADRHFEEIPEAAVTADVS